MRGSNGWSRRKQPPLAVIPPHKRAKRRTSGDARILKKRIRKRDNLIDYSSLLLILLLRRSSLSCDFGPMFLFIRLVHGILRISRSSSFSVSVLFAPVPLSRSILLFVVPVAGRPALRVGSVSLLLFAFLFAM
eukprot:GHVU01042030.1.p1 GENE.GHVU01042030.1~~GHVU01042030.1.p1  ORF type:complete len:133 (-),score=2.64 GHVU01042030.1:114-512(-)